MMRNKALLLSMILACLFVTVSCAPFMISKAPTARPAALDAGDKAFADKDYAKAYELYLEAAMANPDNYHTHMAVGKAAAAADMSDEALWAFERVTILDKRNGRAKYEMAMIYEKLGFMELAYQFYSAARNEADCPVIRKIAHKKAGELWSMR